MLSAAQRQAEGRLPVLPQPPAEAQGGRGACHVGRQHDVPRCPGVWLSPTAPYLMPTGQTTMHLQCLRVAPYNLYFCTENQAKLAFFFSWVPNPNCNSFHKCFRTTQHYKPPHQLLVRPPIHYFFLEYLQTSFNAKPPNSGASLPIKANTSGPLQLLFSFIACGGVPGGLRYRAGGPLLPRVLRL
jgi:hypothetical protein